MKVESAEIKDEEFVSKVVDAVKQMEEEITTLVGIEYGITELRVNLKEGRVFVVWENYADDVEILKKIIANIVEAYEQLQQAKTEVERADAIIALGKLNEQLNRVVSISLRDVINIVQDVKSAKSQGMTVEDIVERKGYPKHVVKAIWSIV